MTATIITIDADHACPACKGTEFVRISRVRIKCIHCRQRCHITESMAGIVGGQKPRPRRRRKAKPRSE